MPKHWGRQVEKLKARFYHLEAESTTVSRGRQQQQEHQKTLKLSTNEDKNRNAGLMWGQKQINWQVSEKDLNTDEWLMNGMQVYTGKMAGKRQRQEVESETRLTTRGFQHKTGNLKTKTKYHNINSVKCHLLCQTNHQNKCWQSTFLKITDMLKLSIPIGWVFCFILWEHCAFSQVRVRKRLCFAFTNLEA